MRLIHVLTAAALALLAVPATAASLSNRDADYLKTAIQIQNGRYAMASYEAQHGTGAAKKLAASVQAQSAQDSRRLQKIADKFGITPDKGLLIQDKYHYSQLVGTNGAQADKSFARELRISDDINKYTYSQEMKDGQNGTLKSHAKQRYTALEHELKTLKGI